MPTNPESLTRTYIALTRLYKNPTRYLYGAAAYDAALRREYARRRAGGEGDDHDAELYKAHAELLRAFRRHRWGEKSSLYFKILALLYEVDDYRGIKPSVEDDIRDELSLSIKHFQTEREGAVDWRDVDFGDADTRSLWKAKVLCGVARIESSRRRLPAKELLRDLRALEKFVEEKLHRRQTLPAWTTLAFVRVAQARVARQAEEYSFVERVLRRGVECLDYRAAEIVEKLTKLCAAGAASQPHVEERNRLLDELVFVRQKRALSLFFNVGLANLQRGYLRNAKHACLAARFEFRLTGQTFHRLYNELLLVSIQRGETPQGKKQNLSKLKDRLKNDLLKKLEPKGSAGNPKLYLYGLRELAVIQLHCNEFEEAQHTLAQMEAVEPLARQWKSRIGVLRARAIYRRWRQTPQKAADAAPLHRALAYSEDAFDQATGLRGGISKYEDARSLLASVRGGGREDLDDTMESLISYGTVQLFLGNPEAATKSGEAVIALAGNDNPRLRAMGHLVLAEAFLQDDLTVKAGEHLSIAKGLEGQIDHKYVADRRRAVEKEMSKKLVFTGGETFREAVEHLLGWYILHHSSLRSIKQIHQEIKAGRKKISDYIRELDESSPFYDDLKELKKRFRKEIAENQKQHQSKSGTKSPRVRR